MNTLTHRSNVSSSTVGTPKSQKEQGSQPSDRMSSFEDLHASESTQEPDRSLPKQNKGLLIQTVIESWMDGILILTDKGEIYSANRRAHQICHDCIKGSSQTNAVPEPIWRVCKNLIESRNLFPEKQIDLEDEIRSSSATMIRIRARWIDLPNVPEACMVVTLEDRLQSTRNMAIAEARKFGLTDREAQVWLLRRANYSYKAVASELHISLDTVRKHVKNINAKRDAFEWATEPS